MDAFIYFIFNVGIHVNFSWVTNFSIIPINFNFIKEFSNFFSHSHKTEWLKSGDNSNAVDAIVPTMIVLYSLFLIFVFCEFGERVCSEFNIFHEKLCHCDWYLFPLEMQKMLLIILSSTQQPASIQGYANTQCTRDAFKSVNISEKSPFHNKILRTLVGLVLISAINRIFRL